MKTHVFYAGAAAALLLSGSARAEDAQPAQMTHPENAAAHAAMHEAMQHQMTAPTAGAQLPAEMPGMPDRASATATQAREHAAHDRYTGHLLRRARL